MGSNINKQVILMFADYNKKEFIQTLLVSVFSVFILYFSMVGLFLFF